MYFCNYCGNEFDIIEKQINVTQKNKKTINNVSTLIKKIMNPDENLDDYNIDIDKSILIKNKEFNNLSEKQKEDIYKSLQPKDTSKKTRMFCNNCTNMKSIDETILVFKKSFKKESYIDQSDYDFYINDPLLPRTHDYTCKNKKCETHKNKSLKEAVFVKEDGSNLVTYICCVCSYGYAV